MKSWFPFLCFILLANFASANAQAVNDNTTLLSRLAPQGNGNYTDIWGYAAGGREYALMGHFNGIFIIDVTNPRAPVQVAFINGPGSGWRDIKTHSHYAYVTNEASGGLQIIDLQNLPNSAASVKYYSATFESAHNLYIDNGYAYIAGSNSAQGINILDLRDPVNPVEVGRWDTNYWHDVVAKNDTLYGSVIYQGTIEIVDARDKSRLVLISATQYPDGFTHNIWMTDDNNFISQTDEANDLPVNFWDVSDHHSPELVATYNAGPNSIAHNTHIRGDYAFISYYYDGLKVLDLSDRRFPVEVGNYDTFPDDNLQRGGAYEGAWGAYPFLPSGNLLVSDRKYGLHVIQFNNARAGYLTGKTFDAATQMPLPDVKLELLNRPTGEGTTQSSPAADGSFLIGAKAGLLTIKFSKFGYEDFTLNDFSLPSGQTVTQDIFMQPLPAAVLPIAVRTQNGQPVNRARVVVKREGFRTELQTDQNGQASLQLPHGTYLVLLSQWGLVPTEVAVAVNTTTTLVTLETEVGYVETFTEAQVWELRELEDQSLYDWLITPAQSVPYGVRLPDSDHTGDAEGIAAISRARYGASTLTSPAIDATVLDDPYLIFARYFNPYYWDSAQANDTLKILASSDNGSSWKQLDAFHTIDRDWHVLQYRLSDFIAPTATMLIRFVNLEGLDSFRASSFCMLDDIQVVSNPIATRVETAATLPTTLELYPNFPNPFNPETTIRWRQPTPGNATISVYDLAGRNLIEERIASGAAGLHSHLLNMNAFGSGVYFYRISVNSVDSPIRKMSLLK